MPLPRADKMVAPLEELPVDAFALGACSFAYAS